MNVETLLTQLQFMLDENFIEETDEVILVGSGDAKPRIFTGGVLGPKIESVEIEVSNNGLYALGFADQKGIALK